MLIALYLILGYFFLFFIVGTLIKNNSIVDIGWGLGYVYGAWVLFFIFGAYNITAIVLNIVVSLWGLRLFYYILKRNVFQEEDFRYRNWRKAWGKWVIPRAFLQVFMLQGVFMYIIGSTVFYVNVYETPLQLISLIGLVLWAIGYFYEVVGDAQLKTHIRKKTGTLMTSGLWKHTRHPNYFGEVLMWWGIFVFVALNGVPLYLIVSPLLITFVLVKISTPILEAKMNEKPEWKAYAEQTSMLIPLPHRKNA